MIKRERIKLTPEHELRRHIAECLGISQKDIQKSIKVEREQGSGRFVATIASDPDQASHLLWEQQQYILVLDLNTLKNIGHLKIDTFDPSIFFLECDLRFVKCNFNCNLAFDGPSNKEIKAGIDYRYCIFLQQVYFSDLTFQKEVNFVRSTFQQQVIFYNLEFKGEANFSDSTFQRETIFSDSTFQQQVSFSKSTFEQQADFSKSIFEQLANFSNSKFEQQANFSDSTFQGETHFNYTLFKDHSSFWHCDFEKAANFYSATFKKVPNFSQALFRNHLNAVNIQTDFGFDEIKQAIEQTKKKFDQHNPKNKDKKPLANFANDFRDSFRVFKSALIKENNLLDASNYHKMELYAKELELSYRLLEKKNLKDQSPSKTELNQSNPEQEGIKESDTKTAPEQNQNAKDKDLKTTLKQENTKEMNNQESQHQINFFQILTWLCDAKKRQNTIDLVQLIFYRHTSDHHTDLFKIIGWILAIIGIFGVLLFACRYGLNLENFLNNHSGNAYVQLFQASWIIGCQKFIIGIFYLIVLLSVIGFFTFLRWIFMISPLFVVLSMILIQPKYILGIGSLFGSKISQNPYENLLMVVYSIVMLLLLFSLQKTARKNSIMPT